MILSENSEKFLKGLDSKRKNYKREENYKDPYIVTLDVDDIKKILPNESSISLRGLLNYLLKEEYIYNNISSNENFMQIFIGEKGIAYLNHKKYILLSKILPISISVLSLVVSIFNMFQD